MTEASLDQLRKELERINYAILGLLSERGEVVTAVQRIKKRRGMPTFIPERERQMLGKMVAHNPGPFPDDTIRHLFNEIFRASVALMEVPREQALPVSRTVPSEDLQR